MTPFVALLRAVNVGGSGKLAMADLKAICEAAGFLSVRTYIASGNVVLQSGSSEAEVKAALEARLQIHVGKPAGVAVRTAAEMADIVAGNPFPHAPGNQVAVLFLDEAASPAVLEGIKGRSDTEELRLGLREIYIHYGSGMARTKLVIPAATTGTMRNMNTVSTLAVMALEGTIPPHSAKRP